MQNIFEVHLKAAANAIKKTTLRLSRTNCRQRRSGENIKINLRHPTEIYFSNRNCKEPPI